MRCFVTSDPVIMMIRCKNCGSDVVVDAKYCDECGALLDQTKAPSPTSQRICPACGTGNVGMAIFCEYCGERINAEQPKSIKQQKPQKPEEKPEQKSDEIKVDLYTELPKTLSQRTEDELNFIKIFAQTVREKKFKQEYANKLIPTPKKTKK